MRKKELPSLPPPSADKAGWLDACGRAVAEALGVSSRREVVLSGCRLATFLAAIVGLFVWVDTPLLAGGSLIGGFLLFLLARRHHRRAAEQVKIDTLLKTVLDESEKRLGGNVVVIRSATRPAEARPMDGAESPAAATLSPQELEDLDVFAEPMGLFGILNRTSTGLGAARLADGLARPLLDADAIRERQAAVTWLDARPDRRLVLLAAAAGLRGQEEQLALLARTVRDAQPLPRFAASPLLRIWSIVAFLGFLVALGTSPERWLLFVFLLALVNSPIYFMTRRPLLDRIRPWLRLDVVVPRLAFATETAVELLPAEGKLGALCQAFRRAAEPAALPALAARIPFLFLGYSGALHKIINALTLWDLHWVCALERSYLRHREEILGAIDALAQFEVLLSLGCFAWEQPAVCTPTIETEGKNLVLRGGLHPLIPPDEVVGNDLDLSAPARVWIITGSNMSGKSTFLRTVGTCCIIAQAGGLVPAAEMTLTPAPILTDLRIRDDLGKHESYFLAEVRQVKRMLDRSCAGDLVLGLVDEPFRGTNSEERLGAAFAVIEALIEGNGFFLVATHDRQVTSLADGDVVSNHHFQETLEEDILSFDYRIRAGSATVRNAIRVLKAEGYPESVVEAAERFAKEMDALGQ